MPFRLAAALALAPAAVFADVPHVATDIAPVHSLVAQVMDGLGEPALLVRPGASPHGYAMRPSEAAALQDADLVVWVGEALEPWLEEPIETLSGGATLELLAVPGTTLLDYRHGHAHEEHGEGHDAQEHQHHDGTDAHAWLDPENGRVWLTAIAEALAGADPENAEAYRANAEAGRARIDAAEEDARAALAPHLDAPFLVYHDAYQYLEASFGLQAATALALGDAAPPSPARVAEITARVEATGAACVFAEPQFSPALLGAVTEGSGARVATLDPLGGEIAPGPGLYPELIRRLAGTIAECAAG